MIILKEIFSFQNVWFRKFGTSKRSIQVVYFETVFSKFVLILPRPTHHLLYFSWNCIEFGKLEGTGEQEISQNAFSKYLQPHHLEGRLLFLEAAVRSTELGKPHLGCSWVSGRRWRTRGRRGQEDMQWGRRDNTPRGKKIIKAD